VSQKQATIILPITSSNVDRFSKISLIVSLVSMQQNGHKLSHHTLNMLLHYLVKCQYRKTSEYLKHVSLSTTNHKVLQLHVLGMVDYSVISLLRIYCWFAGEKIFIICEHLAKLQARSHWPTNHHKNYAKAFCCNIFSSVLQQMRTIILWEF